MPYPRVLVITSCTGEKQSKPENQLVLADFKNADRLQKREAELADFSTTAGTMYTGMQHLRLMEGVLQWRGALGQNAVDLGILSAGYGLIEEDRLIVPYEVTFNSMKGHEVDGWARSLGLHDAFEKAIAPYDLIFLLLGENYLRSLILPVETRPDQTLVFLASNSSTRFIRALAAKIFILPLSNADAKRYRYGLVGLKGFLFKRFAEAVCKDAELLKAVYEEPTVFQEVIDQQETQLELTLGLSVSAAKKASKQVIKPPEEDYLAIPPCPPAPNVHLGMQYYIPEWDDRVDPNYDFLTDTLTPGRDPYNDIYAHEIYPSPNYDGILVSKVVVDESKTKRARVEAAGGIHDFIRFPGQIMGDCGAFGYIKEEVPPYNTDEILEYYENLGFNYGVSIDHLIVGPFAQPGEREKRYEITLKNAEDFIQKHRELGYTFTPMGVAQGWNPESYANAVKEVISMGYDYVALGGLARAQTRDIVPILKAIYPHLKPHVRLHLFGVARIEAIPVFRHLGVTSFDSASPLRQAWLSGTKNYHTLSSKTFMAIRVPPTERGLKIKRALESGSVDLETFKRHEQEALDALRQFDVGTLDLETTLKTVLTYSKLIEEQENKTDSKKYIDPEPFYLEILKEKPWNSCKCLICQELGIETVIFRNNDRNRRRGFHNTYVFYRRFKALLEENLDQGSEQLSRLKHLSGVL